MLQEVHLQHVEGAVDVGGLPENQRRQATRKLHAAMASCLEGGGGVGGVLSVRQSLKKLSQRRHVKSPGNQEKPRDSYPPRLSHALLPPGMCQLRSGKSPINPQTPRPQLHLVPVHLYLPRSLFRPSVQLSHLVALYATISSCPQRWLTRYIGKLLKA